MERIHACYRLLAPASEIGARARAITYEQTVEVPEGLITSAEIREQVVGRVEGIEAIGDGLHHVTISYTAALCSWQLPQLLNLIFGNVSMLPGVRLIDLRLPDGVLARFGGPRHGIRGIRRRLGVHDRPLLSTALKPRGAPVGELAEMARQFALGGGDIVKDDHNLVDESVEAFRERILPIRDAMRVADRETGEKTLYLPNLSVRADEVGRTLDLLIAEEIDGVLISPLLVGLDLTRVIAARSSLIVMTHPSFSGAYLSNPDHGITPELLLGTLFRLAGADASVFPNIGGRFPFTRDDCRAIRDHLREPLGDLAPTFPTPAGGMHFNNLGSMAEDYGPEAIFLVGGALHSHSQELREGTRAFLEEIGRHFAERREPPAKASPSASEPHTPTSPQVGGGEPVRHLAIDGDYRWREREMIAYKNSGELPFQGIQRSELIGRNGEQTAYNLRYFEIEPGGFSSLEKHRHTHTIIGVRGKGTLLRGRGTDQRSASVAPFDVAYIPPLEVHQLRNDSSEPFGFFCVVDRDRDRPMEP
ncbi:MAG: RuBisCO large subunit C-terminal-like domain-containing protein [Planctomycetota bacterium]